ncbi:hypothetical protein [Wolbachia pipientis]|nr:hypothetical protein [Wolbachia pipientis]
MSVRQSSKIISIKVINVSNESWIPVSATWITFRYVIPALDAGI